VSGSRVYLDYAATTPVDPRVLDVMLPYFTQTFGNPSSVHLWGQQAEAAVEEARADVSAILHCLPAEIIFTSGGSESDNLALRGAAMAERARRGANRILTTPVEHDAVLRTARQLANSYGFEVDLLPVDGHGRVDPDDLRRHIRPETAVVSIIYANNEIGTINPIAELGRVCRSRGIPFHTDAVQAASQLLLAVDNLNVDLMSVGAHKFYGPKGIGALYARNGQALLPILTGGGQEASRRAGTHNVPLIAGLAKSLYLTAAERTEHNLGFQRLRDRLLQAIPECIPRVLITGHPTDRSPNHASFAIHELDGNALLAALDLAGFACSSGSACKTGNPEPSDVLTAIGLAQDWALGSLRVTVGRSTSPAQIDAFIEILPALVQRLRGTRVKATGP
jgi:cysteine desulfurase